MTNYEVHFQYDTINTPNKGFIEQKDSAISEEDIIRTLNASITILYLDFQDLNLKSCAGFSVYKHSVFAHKRYDQKK
jgi:hypothetical protein